MEKKTFGPSEDGKTLEIEGTKVTTIEIAPLPGVVKRTQEIVFEDELSMFVFIMNKIVEADEKEDEK